MRLFRFISAWVILFSVGFNPCLELAHSFITSHYYCAFHNEVYHEPHDHVVMDIEAQIVANEAADEQEASGHGCLACTAKERLAVLSNPGKTFSFLVFANSYPKLWKGIFTSERELYELSPKNSPPGNLS